MLGLPLGLALAGAGLLAAAVQAVTGAGFGLIAAPLVMLLVPGLVPGPLLVVTVVLMAVAALAGLRNGGGTGGRLRREDARLLVPAGLGIIAGCALSLPALGWVGDHDRAVTLIVGAGVLVAVVPMLVPRLWAAIPVAGPRGMAGAGVLAGVLTVVAALPGPPLILTYRQDSAARYRTGLAVLFLVASVAALVVLGCGGGVAPDGWDGVWWFSGGVVAGFVIGWVAGRRLPLAAVTLGSRLTVLVAAVALVVSGVG